MSMFKSLQTDDPLFYVHINIQLVLHAEPVKSVRKIIEEGILRNSDFCAQIADS